FRMISAAAGLITQVLRAIDTARSEMKTAGSGLGYSLIVGMIEGLLNESSALYLVIANIVTAAIAAANAAAGSASPSKRMIELGKHMGEGLVVGFQSMLGDVQSAVTRGVGGLSVGSHSLAFAGGGPTAQLARAPAASTRTRGIETSKAARWDNVTVNVNTLEPGPVARRVEQTLRRLSLQAELSATRG
ncbi:hypothetical protein LCGC14_2555720, partial [marine sediment metagenome]